VCFITFKLLWHELCAQGKERIFRTLRRQSVTVKCALFTHWNKSKYQKTPDPLHKECFSEILDFAIATWKQGQARVD
jgi:hypothetical protein